jgi:hypothetical protein
MKNILAAIFLASTAALPLLAEEAKQALIVEAPATWKVEFKGDKGMQFYTVTRKEGDTALLMFSRWPTPGNVNQIPEQIETIAKGFVGMAKDNKDIKLKTDQYKIEEISGDTFSGSFVQFEIEGGISQTMFMIGDAEGIWNGQFTGTKERWVEALVILKKLKKKSESGPGE